MEESEEIIYYRTRIIQMVKKVRNIKVLKHLYTVLRKQ